MEWYDIVGRLMAATVAGFALGVDREMRGKSAGLRTHGLVALSSAIITVSALSFYFGDGPQSDPLRVVQGLAQAIGFIVAGSIFVSRGNVRNLTSAANLWLAAALGISAGMGQYLIVFAGICLGLMILIVAKAVERHFLRSAPDTDHDLPTRQRQ
jgi:putative Mg2+ transporter-C (MgtC) family protein